MAAMRVEIAARIITILYQCDSSDRIDEINRV